MRQLFYTIACAALALAMLPATVLADELSNDNVTSEATEAVLSDEGLEAESVDEPIHEYAIADDVEDESGDEVSEAEAYVPAEEASVDEGPCNEDFAMAEEPLTEPVTTETEGGQETSDASEPASTNVDTTVEPAENDTIVETDEPSNINENVTQKAEESEQSVNATAATTKSTATVVAPASTSISSASKKASKVAKKANAVSGYFVDNAIYYISSALAKKGAFAVSVKDYLGRPKTNVELAQKVKQLSQYWRVQDKGKGVYRFVNCAGGYYLAVKGSVKKRANVYVAKSGIIDWKVIKNSDGTFSLKPVANKTSYLSVAYAKAKKGANVQLWPSISNKGQKFTFTINKRLTNAYKLGKTVKPGIVKIASPDTTVRVGVSSASVSENAAIKTFLDGDKTDQVFQMRYLGNGLYEFQNANSYKVLTVIGSGKTAGDLVVQSARTRQLNQVWYLKPVENGYQIISAKSGLALDIAGGKAAKGKALQIQKASSVATQAYEFPEARLVANGTYVMQSAMALPLVLSVKGNSKDNGANVELKRSAGKASERFKIVYVKDGMYRITNASSKKRVEVAGSSKTNGANIQMGTASSADNQLWTIELGEDGLMFKSVASGKYLNVNNKQAKSGANIDQRYMSGTSNQCWTLASSDWSFYSAATSVAMKLIKKAESYEGWRYKWGGRSPSTSFDCAGLVMYCSNKAWGTHFDLMNTNAEMLYDKCKHIKASNAKPGDLVFYRGTYGSDISYISHVVIYVGNGYMFGAGDPIGYAKVNSVKNIRGKTAKAVYARIKH